MLGYKSELNASVVVCGLLNKKYDLGYDIRDGVIPINEYIKNKLEFDKNYALTFEIDLKNILNSKFLEILKNEIALKKFIIQYYKNLGWSAVEISNNLNLLLIF